MILNKYSYIRKEFSAQPPESVRHTDRRISSFHRPCRMVYFGAVSFQASRLYMAITNRNLETSCNRTRFGTAFQCSPKVTREMTTLQDIFRPQVSR